jgi:hypothetical protein
MAMLRLRWEIEHAAAEVEATDENVSSLDDRRRRVSGA